MLIPCLKLLNQSFKATFPQPKAEWYVSKFLLKPGELHSGLKIIFFWPSVDIINLRRL